MSRILFLILATVLFAQIAVSGEAPQTDRPTWAAGDTWSYRVLNGGIATLKVLSADSNGYVVQEITTDHKTNIRKYDLDVTWTEGYYAKFQFPLSIGKQWSKESTGEAAGPKYGSDNTWETTWVVKSFEPLTVPAGTFDTFRIAGRQCNIKQQNQCGDFVVWYAPQVKSFIKLSWLGGSYWTSDQSGKSQVLVSYQTAP